MTEPVEILLVEGDLGAREMQALGEQDPSEGLGVDLETLGLRPGRGQIQVVTLGTPRLAVVLLSDGHFPSRAAELLVDPSVPKIFHNALFDLSFLLAEWDLPVVNVNCTKVAARLAEVRPDHLSDLVKRYVGVDLDKSLQTSDWRQRPLSAAQAAYAANDVVHLHTVLRELLRELSDAGRTQLYYSAMGHLPHRAELELLGLGDVFAYRRGEPPLGGEARNN